MIEGLSGQFRLPEEAEAARNFEPSRKLKELLNKRY